MNFKYGFIPLTLLLLALPLAACGRNATPSSLGEPGSSAPLIEPSGPPPQPIDTGDVDEIVFYIQSDYIDPEIYALFQELAGIEVTEENFSDNQDMLAKLAGLRSTESYALIVSSNYNVGIMIQEGMLVELDHSKIPNLINLADEFQNLPYDPGNRFCVPYQWGTLGLGFDSSLIDPPSSWSILFQPNPTSQSFGRTTMLNNVRESFSAALIYLGYDINTTNESQLEEAKNLLIQAKPGLNGYNSDTYEDLLASGENVLALGLNKDFIIAQEMNKNLVFSIPDEGGVIWVDNLCIPSTVSPEKKAVAENFINFLLDPEIGALLSEYNYDASPNAASEALFSEEFLNDPTLYPPDNVLTKLQFIKPVGEFELVYLQLWDEVKTASLP